MAAQLLPSRSTSDPSTLSPPPAPSSRAVPPTDGELLARARAGDEAAFGALYERHRTMLCRVAARYRRDGDVDDVVNQAFTATWSALANGLGPQVNPAGYLVVAVRRACMPRSRLDVGAAGGSVELDRLSRERRGDGDLDLELARTTSSEATVATELFARLTPRHRHVLWALYVEQRTHHEVARELGVEPNALSAVAHRARLSLRRSLDARADPA